MKGSAVVQGFKSFLDKLHPTLPLTTRESNHLLSALKSSFRNHLDEVHPRTTVGDERERRGKDVSKHAKLRSSPSHMPSSAAAAEIHLSSILTNPLLATLPPQTHAEDTKTKSKVGSEHTSAVLQHDQEVVEAVRKCKAPIDLLEQYQRTGQASVSTAALCLHAFKDSLDQLAEDKCLDRIRSVQPGKRTFQWLWSSGLHTSSLCFADKRFNEILIYFMLLEDREQDLWDWLRLDDVPADEHTPSAKAVRGATTMTHSRFRWKGRLLAMMAETKLRPPFVQTASADNAISVCLRASAMKHSTSRSSSMDSHLKHLPIAPCFNAVFHHYNRHPRHYKATNPALFDKFVSTMAASSDHPINMMFVALLLTTHPTNPSGTPLLDQMKLVFTPDFSNSRLTQLHESIIARPMVYFSGTIRAAVRLEQSGDADGAALIVSKIPELFPKQAWYQLALENMRREIVSLGQKTLTTRSKDESMSDEQALTIFT